jgi:hypothetical protein
MPDNFSSGAYPQINTFIQNELAVGRTKLAKLFGKKKRVDFSTYPLDIYLLNSRNFILVNTFFVCKEKSLFIIQP